MYTHLVQQFLISKRYYYYYTEASYLNHICFLGCKCVYDLNSLIFAVLLCGRKIGSTIHGWRNRSNAQDVKAESGVEYFYIVHAAQILCKVFCIQFGR